MGKLIILTILLVILQFTVTWGMQLKKSKKCRALVLEGGGDKGSFQAGALQAFVDNLPEEEIMYDVVTGVSVGAINAAALSLHEIGKEKEAVEFANNMWKNITSDKIYTSWPLGYLQGLVFEEGLWNNAVELPFLNGTFYSFGNQTIYRKTNIITVDFDNGDIITFDETTPVEKLAKAIVASTSMPFAFPHMHMDNHTYVDGGSVWNIDLSGAIERCHEVVEDDKDIIVDVILCTGAQNITRDEHKSYGTLSNYERYHQLKSYYGTLSDYYEIMRGYPNVDFRYLVVPEAPLPSGYLPLNFKHEDILAMIRIGQEEGKKAIENATNSYDRFKEHLKRTMFHGLDIV